MNPFIGIGAGLSEVPAGLMQGEEIQRRRAREDAAQAWAEKQQARQEGEWGRIDAYRQAMALGTPEEQIRALQEAGHGDLAEEVKMHQEAAARTRKEFDLNVAQKELGIRAGQRAEDEDKFEEAAMGLFRGFQLGAQNPEALQAAFAKYGPVIDQRMPGMKQIGLGHGLSRFGDQNIQYTTVGADGKPKQYIMGLGQFASMIGSKNLQHEADIQRSNWLQQQQLGLQRSALSQSQTQVPVTPAEIVMRAKASGGFANPAEANYARAGMVMSAAKAFDDNIKSGGADSFRMSMKLPPDVKEDEMKRFYVANELDRYGLLSEEGLKDIGLNPKRYEELGGRINENQLPVRGMAEEALKRLTGMGGPQSETYKPPQDIRKTGKSSSSGSSSGKGGRGRGLSVAPAKFGEGSHGIMNR